MKASKKSVDYTPNAQGHHDHCAICKHFVFVPGWDRVGICGVVAGEIAKKGWCKKFEEKSDG